jgi:hypothetical protein
MATTSTTVRHRPNRIGFLVRPGELADLEQAAGIDPRNRRVDLIGKYVGDAPDPVDYKRMSTFSYLNRAQRFAQASQLLLGAPPPREWFQDEEDYVPADDDPNVHHGPPDDEPPNHPFRRKR